MKTFSRLIVLFISLWCFFWWGHYFGSKSALGVCVSGMRSDVYMMEHLVRAKTSISDENMIMILKNKNEEINLWSKYLDFYMLTFITYPLFAPVTVYEMKGP
jgi:hypothetical protein